MCPGCEGSLHPISSFLILPTYLWDKMDCYTTGLGMGLMVWREKGPASPTKLRLLAMDPGWLEPGISVG